MLPDSVEIIKFNAIEIYEINDCLRYLKHGDENTIRSTDVYDDGGNDSSWFFGDLVVVVGDRMCLLVRIVQ